VGEEGEEQEEQEEETTTDEDFLHKAVHKHPHKVKKAKKWLGNNKNKKCNTIINNKISNNNNNNKIKNNSNKVNLRNLSPSHLNLLKKYYILTKTQD